MPIAVERKLFATGDSLAVTLPKDWARYFKLKAGDIVEVVANNELTIRVKCCDKNTDIHTDLTDTK
jgi:antitoxin component of MazEF toxin-antitoxin module